MDLLVEALRIGLIDDFRIEPFVRVPTERASGIRIDMSTMYKGEKYSQRQIVSFIEIEYARLDEIQYRIIHMLYECARLKEIEYPESLRKLEKR